MKPVPFELVLRNTFSEIHAYQKNISNVESVSHVLLLPIHRQNYKFTRIRGETTAT